MVDKVQKRVYSVTVYNSPSMDNEEYLTFSADSEPDAKVKALMEATKLASEYESIDGFTLFCSVDVTLESGKEFTLYLNQAGEEDTLSIDWLD